MTAASGFKGLPITDTTTTVIGLHTGNNSVLVAAPYREPRPSWPSWPSASEGPGILPTAYGAQVPADRR